MSETHGAFPPSGEPKPSDGVPAVKMRFHRMDDMTRDDFAILRRVHERNLDNCRTCCSAFSTAWVAMRRIRSTGEPIHCRPRRAL